ncbi:hypothetical protein RCL_jg5224.t1 [Rhizophagus clarus]|uniref:Cardiolipin synthase N-terminal domain-containing protein n=1 Tax=Rhizophagus clarus TaxID=94130 RepID=A0A8H3LL75_9GLOM|nr:hypothetical protein RCL_jg5224.t1 [Rhizophagus clarus]
MISNNVIIRGVADCATKSREGGKSVSDTSDIYCKKVSEITENYKRINQYNGKVLLERFCEIKSVPMIATSVLFFLAIFILDGLAIIEIIKSKRRDWDKLLWVFLILFFQIFGLIAYFFLSDRKRYKRASWYQNIP